MFKYLFYSFSSLVDHHPLSHICIKDYMTSLLTTELKCRHCNFELTDEEKAILNLCGGIQEVAPDIRQIRVSINFIKMYNINFSRFYPN